VRLGDHQPNPTEATVGMRSLLEPQHHELAKLIGDDRQMSRMPITTSWR